MSEAYTFSACSGTNRRESIMLPKQTDSVEIPRALWRFSADIFHPFNHPSSEGGWVRGEGIQLATRWKRNSRSKRMENRKSINLKPCETTVGKAEATSNKRQSKVNKFLLALTDVQFSTQPLFLFLCVSVEWFFFLWEEKSRSCRLHRLALFIFLTSLFIWMTSERFTMALADALWQKAVLPSWGDCH